MAVDAPLSYGQLYSWREVETYPQDWMREANLSTTWGLRGIAADRVVAALQRLVDWHESLRTSYYLRAGEPVQRIHDPALPPIEMVDRVITCRGDWNRAEDEVAATVGAPFPMTGDVGWRGALVSSGGDPMFLSLSFSHLIVDIWSILRLEAQFRALVADLDTPAQLGPTPRELAYSQPGEPDSGVRYWRRVLDDDSMYQLPSLPAGMKRHRIQATLHSRRLGWLAAQAAKRHGVTTPSVLMALVAAGLSWHLDADDVMMSLMSSNRFGPGRQHIIGTMNQLIPVVATVDHSATYDEHIKHLHWVAARAYRYSCYDFDRVAALADMATHGHGPAHGSWFNHLFRCWFNYIQFDDQPPDPGEDSPAELVWTPVARQYGQPLDIRVTARRGSMSVALRADPTVIPAEYVTDILRAVAVGVELAANDPIASLKEMWSGNLSPSMFPSELPAPPH